MRVFGLSAGVSATASPAQPPGMSGAALSRPWRLTLRLALIATVFGWGPGVFAARMLREVLDAEPDVVRGEAKAGGHLRPPTGAIAAAPLGGLRQALPAHARLELERVLRRAWGSQGLGGRSGARWLRALRAGGRIDLAVSIGWRRCGCMPRRRTSLGRCPAQPRSPQPDQPSVLGFTCFLLLRVAPSLSLQTDLSSPPSDRLPAAQLTAPSAFERPLLAACHLCRPLASRPRHRRSMCSASIACNARRSEGSSASGVGRKPMPALVSK